MNQIESDVVEKQTMDFISRRRTNRFNQQIAILPHQVKVIDVHQQLMQRHPEAFWYSEP